MATVALFPSVLGVRPGIQDAVDRLSSMGHDVRVLDQNEGRVFDEYEAAMAYAEEEVGTQAMYARALQLAEGIPDGFVVAGFSMGGGLATYVADKRKVKGLLLLSAAMDPKWIEMKWRADLPVQIHNTLGDPWREQEQIEAVEKAAKEAGAHVEVYDYPGNGHLFADPSKEDEYQAAETDLMWSRAGEFLSRFGG